ncbi:hypothetical protein NHX12_033282 [Muraenolepis orangiensis]|uniref:Uncharacterized protein n=1 Tax=Muraenolepis orangiensis TaxID=630683 RepID=A0A9Q0IHU1_9TELE|nr:hypothetical protein NHX12_033282 [Muraenolepis orangiensis]
MLLRHRASQQTSPGGEAPPPERHNPTRRSSPQPSANEADHFEVIRFGFGSPAGSGELRAVGVHVVSAP